MKKLKSILSIKGIGIVLLLSASIAITSCGKGSKKEEGKSSAVVVQQKNEIQGYLAKYLEISDGTYKIEKDNNLIFSWVVKVKIHSKARYEEEDYGLNDGNSGPLYLDLYDSYGNPLTGFDNLQSDYTSDTKLADILKAGTGETWITFTKFHEMGTEELPSNVTSFTIGSKKIEKKSSQNTNSDDIKTGNEDYDKVLDDYEEYVDGYLKFLKKANEGDASAITEYTDLLDKADKLSESLEDAKGNDQLTPEQLKRMLKIQKKMASAMSDMN